MVAFGSSLDQVGPFGRRVEDVALAMNALTAGGRDPWDSTSQPVSTDFLAHLDDPIEGRKVGVVPALMEAAGLTDEVRDAVIAAGRALADQGAELVEVELPNIASAIAAYYVIAPCEAFSNLARFDGVRYGYQEQGCATLAEQTSLSRAHGFGEEAKRRQMLGAYLLSSGVYDTYYYPAQQVRTLITADYARAYEQCDVILMPAAPRTAFRFGELSDPTQMYASDQSSAACSRSPTTSSATAASRCRWAWARSPACRSPRSCRPGLRRRHAAHVRARDRAVLLALRRGSPRRARVCREGG